MAFEIQISQILVNPAYATPIHQRSTLFGAALRLNSSGKVTDCEVLADEIFDQNIFALMWIMTSVEVFAYIESFAAFYEIFSFVANF